MARANTKTEESEATIKDGAEAQIADTLVAYDQSMAEVTMARRLYEVWRTAGQLYDPKWEWSKQSDQAHSAWLAVARAASPLILTKHWSAQKIASVNHG
jgi:hypothetical protein